MTSLTHHSILWSAFAEVEVDVPVALLHEISTGVIPCAYDDFNNMTRPVTYDLKHMDTNATFAELSCSVSYTSWATQVHLCRAGHNNGSTPFPASSAHPAQALLSTTIASHFPGRILFPLELQAMNTHI